MKIVAKPIKTMVVFEYDNQIPIPCKFKLKEDSGEEIMVTVNRRLGHKKSKTAGVESIIYECQSVIDGVEKRYELKYIINKCQWQLYKI